MTRFIKHLVRWFLILLVCVSVIAVALVALLMSGWFVNGVLFPALLDDAGISVTAQDWSCRPWSSITADNVVIQQSGTGTSLTGMVIKADAVSVEYDFWSLFSGKPIIKKLALTSPVLGIKSLSVTGMVETSEEILINAEEELAAGKAVLAEMPLSIDLLSITNGSFSYYSLLQQEAHVHNVNLTAHNIGPNRDASLSMTGFVRYKDTNSFKIEEVPLTVNSTFSFLTSVIPAKLDMALSISNITGTAGNLDLAPASSLVTLSYHKTPLLPIIHIDSCNAIVNWADQTLGRFSATGMIHLGSTDLSGRTQLDLKPSPLWQVLSGLDGILDIGQSEMSLDLVTHHDNTRNVTDSRGSVAIHSVSVPTTPEAGTIDFNASFTNSYNLNTQTLYLPFLSVDARQGLSSHLQLRTEKPLTLCFDSSQPLTATNGPPARISALVENMNMSQLSPLLKDSNVIIRDGSLSANMLCDVTGVGEKIVFAGKYTANNLDISVNHDRWKECDLTTQWAGDISNLKHIQVKKFTAACSLDGRPAGEAAAGGFYTFSSGSNRLAIAMSGVTSKLLRPLIDPDKENRALDGLTYSLQALTHGSGETNTAQDNSFKLTINNKPGAGKDNWESFVWQAKAAVSPEKINIKHCDINILPSPWQENKLSLTGTVMLGPTNVPSELLLYSKFFDATSVINTFMPHAQEIASAPGDGKPPVEPVAHEPLPLNLDDRVIILRTNLEHARIRDIIFEPFQAVSTLSNNILLINTREVSLNDGDVNVSAYIDMGVTGYVYNADITLTNIPISPIMNSTLPNNKNSVKGLIASHIRLKGKGITRQNIEDHFEAETHTYMHDGRLLNAPVLKQLGDVLRLKALKELPFERGTFIATMKNGVLNVKESTVDSKSIKTGLRGTMNLDRKLDMDVMLGLSGEEMVKFLSKWIPQQTLPLSTQLTNFYQFPVIPITGSLDDPSLPPADELFKSVYKTIGASALSVMQAILEQGNVEKIKDVFKDNNLKKNVEEGLDMFLDIFSKPKDSKTDPNKKRTKPERPFKIL